MKHAFITLLFSLTIISLSSHANIVKKPRAYTAAGIPSYSKPSSHKLAKRSEERHLNAYQERDWDKTHLETLNTQAIPSPSLLQLESPNIIRGDQNSALYQPTERPVILYHF